MAARAGWRAASVAVGLLFVLAWHWIASAQLISPVFLPGPDRTWRSLVNGLAGGKLFLQLVATIERMIYGWFLASLAGVAVGAVIGISSRARAYVAPMLEFLRPLPAPAIIPPAIALLGLSEKMVLGVIAFGALWPMLLATVHGFAAVERRLTEVARLLALSRWGVIFKIALPSAMPDILSGMRVALTISLILSVVGEMLTGRVGLGSAILLAARSYRSPDLYAGVILLGLIGYLSAVLLSAAEHRLLRWRSIGG